MHITDDDRESAITFSIKQGSAKAGDLFSQLEPRLSQPKSNVRIHLNTKRSSVVTWFEYEKGGDLQANSPPPPPKLQGLWEALHTYWVAYVTQRGCETKRKETIYATLSSWEEWGDNNITTTKMVINYHPCLCLGLSIHTFSKGTTSQLLALSESIM